MKSLLEEMDLSPMDFLAMEQSLEADVNQINTQNKLVKRKIEEIDKFNANLKTENRQL